MLEVIIILGDEGHTYSLRFWGTVKNPNPTKLLWNLFDTSPSPSELDLLITLCVDPGIAPSSITLCDESDIAPSETLIHCTQTSVESVWYFPLPLWTRFIDYPLCSWYLMLSELVICTELYWFGVCLSWVMCLFDCLSLILVKIWGVVKDWGK